MNVIKRLYSGRIGSLAYLVGILMSWGGFWLIGVSNKAIPSNTLKSIIEILLLLLLFVFMFSVFTRRLHDFNKSGWLSLLVFVPLVNAILGIILLFKPGSHEANKFGVPPQGGKYILKELLTLQA
jgi:uncharacterized membrane protein YhaH (DUF805 family)